uniref:Tail tubular protein A n=1 Tax=Aeromonas virus AHPMCC11 TaxID=3035930 RepID=A0AAT9TTM3_9VIRU
MITELDIVNGCLATMGEVPLVEITDDHPFVPAARASFRAALMEVAGRNWWFNTDTVTLRKTEGGMTYAPEDAVSVYPVWDDRLTVRGRRLYNRAEGTYEVGDQLCVVVRLLDFEDLPAMAKVHIQNHAVLSFQKNYDADQLRMSQLVQEKSDSWSILNAEHIRQINYNPMLSVELAIKIMRSGPRGASYRR